MYGTAALGGASNYGTIWKYSASGNFTTLYSFTGGSDGRDPSGGVTFDSSGNMYGTSIGGESAGWGAVWEYSASGNFSVLHAFTGGTDGGYPYGSVTFDSHGNMFGTASSGGALGWGTVWEYSPSGNFSVLYAFNGGVDGSEPEGSVTFDTGGNMYGTAYNGGASAEGTVWEYSAAGNFSVLHTFTGGNDGGLPRGNVTFDGRGNMVGTAGSGGASLYYGTLWEYSALGNFSVLHSFTNGNDGGSPHGSVTFDSSGNMLGTAGGGSASTFYGTVWQYSASGSFSTLYAFTNGNDGSEPYGSVSLDSSGNMVGTALYGGAFGGVSGYGTIWKFNAFNGKVHYVTASPNTVTGGATSTGTVYLTANAPSYGVSLSLSSSSHNAQVPSSITVPAGSNFATFPITTSGVIATEFLNLSATYKSVTASCGFGIGSSIAIHTITSLPSTVTGGAASTGTVKLTNPAPVGGAVVGLTSSNAVAQVPLSVTVPAGQTSATFTVTTSGSNSNIWVNLSATLNGKTVSSGFIVGASVALHFVTISPSSVTGGTSSTGTVTLSGTAPTGGTVLTLTSSDPTAQVPATVTVPGGQSSANFNITTSAVTSNTSLVISASLNGHSAGYGFVVAAPNFSGLSTTGSTTIFGGTSATIKASLNGPAPVGGIVITLSSNSADASVPVTVTIPAGQTSATFTMTTSVVALPETITITGAHTQTQLLVFKLKPIA